MLQASRSSKNFTNTKLVNKEMNDKTYALRRRVIELIYEAKTLVDMPRVDVRITDDHACVLGSARMGKNIIWISERAITTSEFDLRCIVFHELLHTVFNVEHDESCPLMKAIHKPLTKALCHKLFKKWAKA